MAPPPLLLIPSLSYTYPRATAQWTFCLIPPVQCSAVHIFVALWLYTIIGLTIQL
jgi:hypothetical protein